MSQATESSSPAADSSTATLKRKHKRNAPKHKRYKRINASSNHNLDKFTSQLNSEAQGNRRRTEGRSSRSSRNP
uniref:Uncharacterized protein n=1 Tax=Ditylenchus dipsaci TaxID=166011 RepID=A0A915DJE5_9BILA